MILDLPYVDWENFERTIDKMATQGTPLLYPYMFRGQPDNRPLFPSFARRAIAAKLKDKGALGLEKALLEFFRTQAHLFLPATMLPAENDWMKWRVLLQHYGGPTRLLDWTTSPYVAMYFAARSPGRAEKGKDQEGADGVIWMIHRGAHRDATAQRYKDAQLPEDPVEAEELLRNPNAAASIHVVRPQIQSDRMAAQQTIFTVAFHPLADHGAYLEETFNLRVAAPPPAHYPPGVEPLDFLRMIIPREEKVAIMLRLRARLITGATMFPGVDGLGHAADEIAEFGPFNPNRSGGF